MRRPAIAWSPRSWGYRVKVPLLIVLISLATALAISAAIAVSARHWLGEDLRNHASTVAHSLGRGLVGHLSRDDVWEAYEAVRSVASAEGGARHCDIVVLDGRQRVFVSSEPARFGVGATAASLSEPLRHAAGLPASGTAPAVRDFGWQDRTYSVVRAPLVSSDGEVIGALLMSYSHAAFAQRYSDTVATVAVISAVLVMLLLPAGWWLGHRLARPMANATEAIYRLAQDAADKSSSLLPAGRAPGGTGLPPASELARLEHSVSCLERELKEKEHLQQQFVAADRLAAIGRMTSAIAHEINNPLAGMLNALSNLRRDPGLLPGTVSLIERGLQQIRHTLSALLIEAKTTTRSLAVADIEDLHVLILPQARNKRLRLDWSYRPREDLPVSAAPVRQIVLNLLLNAVHAATSRVSFDARVEDASLVLAVRNDGRAFPEERKASPFEPVVGGEGNGLGLWATHQLVTSLGGSITLSAEEGCTSFEVRLALARDFRTGPAQVSTAAGTEAAA